MNTSERTSTPHPLDIAIGEWLRSARGRTGLSRRALAIAATGLAWQDPDIMAVTTERDRAEESGDRERSASLAALVDTLARRRRISPQRVANGEMSAASMGPGHLWRLAKVLELEVAALFDGLVTEVPAPFPAEGAFPKDLDPLRTEDGRILYDAFMAIEDETIRKEIAALVRSIADGYPLPPGSR